MNAPTELALLRAAALPEAARPAAVGGFRYLWQGKFGSMIIEVIDGLIYVNGDPVEPMGAAEASRSEASAGEQFGHVWQDNR